ncbi:M56 family metallopeptidase [Planctomycetaceae bacterium SH139]
MSSGFVLDLAVGVSIQAGLLIAVATFVQSRLTDSHLVCRLWTVTYCLLLCLLAAAILLPHVRWFHPWKQLDDIALVEVVMWQAKFVKAILLLWAVGFGLAICKHILRFYMLLRFLRNECREMTLAELAKLPLADCQRPPDDTLWLLTNSHQGPFSWHLHRPTIVLPISSMQDDSVITRHLLVHELEHLHNKHQFQYFLQGLCGALLWFHPAVWWAASQAGLAREFHCDEISATRVGSVSSYLRALATIAERTLELPKLTLPFADPSSKLRIRIDNLIAKSKVRNAHGAYATPLVFTMLVLSSISISQVWLPVNAMASSRSAFSPWPRWTAAILHDVGFTVRDFEVLDERIDIREQIGNRRIR